MCEFQPAMHEEGKHKQNNGTDTGVGHAIDPFT